MNIIETIQQQEFAGAFKTLRHIDPLYQTEIGIARDWQVRAYRFACGCNCPHCNSEETARKIVSAVTVDEAINLAAEWFSIDWTIDGIRPNRSNCGFAEVDFVQGRAAA